MLIDLHENSTRFDYTLLGVNLGSKRCQMLAEFVAINKSLMSLHLSRKQIQDNEGQDLAKMLLTNNTLRKLELEGNNLG